MLCVVLEAFLDLGAHPSEHRCRSVPDAFSELECQLAAVVMRAQNHATRPSIRE